jgi:DNA polymerase III sliding clamp (beta) subunit (PCNA family)
VDKSSNPPLTGIRIDGKYLEGLSTKQAARIACEVTVDEPVSAVIKDLIPLIKIATDLRMMVQGSKVILALDESTQVTSTTVLGAWPNMTETVSKINYTDTFVLPKQRLVDALDRMITFVRNERLPKVSLTVTHDSLDIYLIGSINGQIQDGCRLVERTGPQIEVPVEFFFNPIWLKEAIETFPGASLRAHFVSFNKPIRLEEPSTSYEAFIMGYAHGH